MGGANLKRRQFIKAAAGVTAATSLSSSFSFKAFAEDMGKPNVLLLMTDDQHWDEVGYNGKGIITPNIDEMAETGIQFNRYYAGHSRCSPTRACIMTGRNNVRSGVMAPNKFIEGQQGINENEKGLPLLFKAAGYRTGHVGKWHIDENKHPSPNDMGYDWARWSHNKYNNGVQLLIDDTGERLQTEGDCSMATVDLALDFIGESKQQNKPFFATIWYGSPHASYECSQEYTDMYPDSPCKEYLAEITGIDVSIGHLRNRLREMGLEQNTQIWFCTDNGRTTQGGCGGGDQYCGGDACYPSQLSRRKKSMYEGGIRVPGTLIWPGVINSHKKIDIPVSGLDFYPTFKEMLGVNFPAGQPFPLDGENVMPIIMGETDDRVKPLPFWGIGSQKRNEIKPGADESALVEKRFKLIRDDDDYKLFDIIEDSREENDLSEVYPDKLETMKQQLQDFEESAVASLAGEDYKSTSIYTSSTPSTGFSIQSIDYQKGKLKIQAEFPTKGSVSFSVYTLWGEKVWQQQFYPGKSGNMHATINLPKLAQGNYLLRTRTDLGTKRTNRFVINEK